MQFGRLGPTRPEQAPKQFHIYRYATSITTERGREKPGERTLHGKARCILASASPQERERYNQIGVTVTHAIIQRGAPIAQENDIFVLEKGGVESRSFRVQAVHNKGELDVDTAYYCEERSDLP